MKRRGRLKFAAAALGAALVMTGGAAFAQDTALQDTALGVSIKDHRFTPAELHAPAKTPITLVVTNLDSTPEEFESKQMRLEKIVAGNGAITLHIRPLEPGRYRFFGEFHEDTAQGVLVVE